MANEKDRIDKAMADALESVERLEKDRPREGEEPVHIEIDGSDVDASAAPQQGGEEAPDPAAAQVAQLKDQLLRLAADFENFRKRSRRQQEEARRYGADPLLQDLLPVVDNLQRALAHGAGREDPVIQGVAMVLKQFIDVVGRHGVQPFESLGKQFDPQLHEAMGQAPAGDQAPGTVLEEMQSGYLLHDRLLRPAKVLVAAPPKEDEPQEPAKQTDAGESDSAS